MPGVMSALIWPKLELIRPSVRRPESRFGSTTERPVSVEIYVVVPTGGLRLRSYALEESRCTPCVHVVPTVNTVSGRISRSICKLPSIMYGKRKCGSTKEMSGAENWDKSEIWCGKTATCWFGARLES